MLRVIMIQWRIYRRDVGGKGTDLDGEIFPRQIWLWTACCEEFDKGFLIFRTERGLEFLWGSTICLCFVDLFPAGTPRMGRMTRVLQGKS